MAPASVLGQGGLIAESCSVLAVWLESAFYLPTYPCRSPAAASSPRHASPRWARVPSRSPSRSRAAACTLSRSRGKPCTSTYPPSPAGGRLRCTPSPPSPTSALTPVLARGATISRRVETAGGLTAAPNLNPNPNPSPNPNPNRNPNPNSNPNLNPNPNPNQVDRPVARPRAQGRPGVHGRPDATQLPHRGHSVARPREAIPLPRPRLCARARATQGLPARPG